MNTNVDTGLAPIGSVPTLGGSSGYRHDWHADARTAVERRKLLNGRQRQAANQNPEHCLWLLPRDARAI